MDDNQIEMMKCIDRYIRGGLKHQEVELLWIEFLEDPKWFEWLKSI